MKRKSCVLLLTLLLCGCNQAESNEASSSGGTYQPEYDVEIDTRVSYDSISDFIDSDFCLKMQNDGFTPYILAFDEGSYTLSNIVSDASTYAFHLTDAETDERLIYSIAYNVYVDNVAQLVGNKLETDGDMVTTFDAHGATYDVYVSKASFSETPEYSVHYVPFEGYDAYIDGSRPTAEEALADIAAFQLVPLNEWELSSNVTQPTEVQAEFEKEEAFYISDFAETMKTAGYQPLLFVFDEVRFTHEGIDADGNSYVNYYVEKETQKKLQYTVSYDTAAETVEDLAAEDAAGNGAVMTAVIGTSEYDAYVFAQEGQYRVSYIPTTGYICTLALEAENPEQAVSYAEAFEPFGGAHWMTLYGDDPSQTLGLVAIEDLDTTTNYDSVDAFTASEFCTEMQNAGYTPYLLSYDEERFALGRIYSDARFYCYILTDMETDESVWCTLEYNISADSVEGFGDNVRVPADQQILTAEKDGVSYEVFVSAAPFTDTPEYSISYIPMEGYKMSISSSSPTPEEALAYIHEIDLVPLHS